MDELVLALESVMMPWDGPALDVATCGVTGTTGLDGGGAARTVGATDETAGGVGVGFGT